VQRVFVSGSFDNLKSRQVRFLQEAARLGSVHILLWSDQTIARLNGKLPRFPAQERQYLLQSLRYVHVVSVTLTDPDASRLRRRYQKHRQSLFVFLYRSDVSPTNNVRERALRPSVIHRKVIGCFRSKWGAHAYAALASVIDTAELNGIDAFAAIQSLFPRPSLPLPQGL
jgi:glycerol-3-phosphate cytidylyltransferase-like family protein